MLRYANLMITMVLGGLWHGAAWTFVAWGALHGVYLCINHAWNHFGPSIAPRFARAADIAALVLVGLLLAPSISFGIALDTFVAAGRALQSDRAAALLGLAAIVVLLGTWYMYPRAQRLLKKASRP